MSSNATLEAALKWRRRGYFVIPVPFGQKRATLPGWPSSRLTDEDLPRYFGNGPTNLGVLLGEPHGNGDVDLDCRQELRAWRVLGLETSLVFGRASKPASHHFYFIDPPPKSTKFTDPVNKECLIELRCLASDGNTGMMTCVPPSRHPSSEAVRFDLDGSPANVEGDLLACAVARTAAAALLARHWPAQGSRNEAFLSMSGILGRAGWRQPDATVFVRALYQCLWLEAPDFAAAEREVEATYRRFREGREVTGFPRLAEIVDKRVLQAALRWLNAESEPRQTLEFNAPAVSADIENLNKLNFFAGRLRFAAIRKHGPLIRAALADGGEIIWRSSAELFSFAKSQAAIADATGVYIPAPPQNKARLKWAPVAELILRIAAAGDWERGGGSSRAEEFRELLPLVWARAGRPRAELPEDLVATLRQCSLSPRNPAGEPAACCVWRVEEGQASAECWLHLPSLLAWLSTPVAMGRRYEWAEVREALWMLNFRYRKDLHRSAGGQEAKASVWIGPAGVLSE